MLVKHMNIRDEQHGKDGGQHCILVWQLKAATTKPSMLRELAKYYNMHVPLAPGYFMPCRRKESSSSPIKRLVSRQRPNRASSANWSVAAELAMVIQEIRFNSSQGFGFRSLVVLAEGTITT